MSRRRSRVRVPSLPSKKSCKSAYSVAESDAEPWPRPHTRVLRTTAKSQEIARRLLQYDDFKRNARASRACLRGRPAATRERRRSCLSSSGRVERQPRKVEAHNRVHATPGARLAVAQIATSHPFVETDRVRLGLPLDSECAEFASARSSTLKEHRPETSTHPLRRDPEVVEPADLSSRDDGGPTDSFTGDLRDEELLLTESRGEKSSSAAHCRTRSTSYPQ
jgi:hypothetical protein